MKINNENYISTMEAAGILKISRIAVFKKIKSGELAAQKFGRNYLIKREDLDQLKNPLRGDREHSKEALKDAVDRTVKQYRETLELLGKEEKE